MACWGAKKTKKGQILLTKEYAAWLASILEEDCNGCIKGPHIDHADCLSEEQAFINLCKGDSKI